MKKLLTVCLLMVATPVFAQQAELNFKLTTDEVNAIGKGLGKLPYEEAAGIIQKMREQYIAQQVKAVSQPPEPKPDDKKNGQ